MAKSSERMLEVEIRGMHCAGCVAAVESALQSAPGVASASVNLATERAMIALRDAPSEPLTGIVQALASAGYEAVPIRADEADGHDRALRRAREHARQRRRLILAALLATPLFIGHLTGGGHAIVGLPFALTAPLSALSAGLVLFIAAGPTLTGALRAALALRGNMDLLVSIGALTAYTSGVVGWLTQQHELILFDAAALIVLFVALGKWLEAGARGHASAALETLANRVPREALLVDGTQLVATSLAQVRPGQVVRLAAGKQIPLDGEMVTGLIQVDESLLTGESRPIARRPGDRVLGGTLVLDGVADARVTAIGSDSAVARIARLVELAQTHKPPWQRYADRLAAWFTPIVLLLSAATLTAWLLSGADLGSALTRAVATLVVACPCALGLAIPTAVLVATGSAAQRGVLVRDPAALEIAGRIDEIFLDKTGTLTLGRPQVTRLDSFAAAGLNDVEALQLAASLERLSDHPIARAVVSAAEARGVSLSDVHEYTRKPGYGASGRVQGRRVLVGSPDWLMDNGVPFPAVAPDAREEADASATWVSVDGQLAARLLLRDELHGDAGAAVAKLRAMGVRTHILSGDRRGAVERVARDLRVDAFESQLLPHEKLARLGEAQRGGKVVAMVGDGVNDAPALAAADVGIAIGVGAEVAREAAQILLIGHSPALIPEALRISRRSAAVMRQNLIWALAYNVVMLPLAMTAPLSPALATAAMMLSSLTVVGNSLRLRRL